ncbi:MAG: sugar transferase, partial [Muribaculaceae bacterium]|nr:sugar transferase [Muribaculaceae bacterium]
MKMNDTRLRLLYVSVDWAMTSVAWVLFNWIRFMLRPELDSFRNFYSMTQVLGGQIFFPLLMLAIYWLSGYYNQPRIRSRAQNLLTTLGSALIGALVIFFLAVVNDIEYRRRVAIELVGSLTFFLFFFVYIGRSVISWYTVLRYTCPKSMLMVGDDRMARKLAASINLQPARMGLRVAGFADPDKEDIVSRCEREGFDTVVISPALASTDRMPDLMSRLMPADLTVLVSPGLNEYRATTGRIGNVVGEPLVDLTHARVSESTLNIKRTLDIVISALALILLSPLMLGLVIAVKLDSPGPAIYRQKRIGRRKREFSIFKFRSMVQDAERQSGPTLTSTDA